MVLQSLAGGSWKPGQSLEISPILFLGFKANSSSTFFDVSTSISSYFLFQPSDLGLLVDPDLELLLFIGDLDLLLTEPDLEFFLVK